MSIIIGADIVPIALNRDLFINGCSDALVGTELCRIMQKADCNICNLEVPLTDHEDPISKFGPNLIAPTASINGLKAMNINAVTLANNHIMDQNASGLMSTIRILEEAGISYVGANKNLNDAQEPLYQRIHERIYGIYACTEHEFSIAEENAPGANPFDPINTFDHIEAMQKHCDYIIVLYHGGKEHYRYPSPNLQKICRKMVEKGANLVICQHSHCIGCKEDYLHGTIIYGQGNFVFPMQDNEFWNTGMLISLDERDNIGYIPLRRSDEGVQLAVGADGEKILEDFFHRSEEIQAEGFIEKKYSLFASESINGYIRYFGDPHSNMLYKGLNYIFKNKIREWVMQKYYRKKRMGLINFIECEAHRELLLEGLKTKNQ